MTRALIMAAALLTVALMLGRSVEAQSIGIGPAEISLPIKVELASDGAGLDGMSLLAAVEGGAISCTIGSEADQQISRCDPMQAVRLAVTDTTPGVWGPGSTANIGSIIVSGISGETRTVWMSVTQADDDFGNPIKFGQIAIQVTIP